MRAGQFQKGHQVAHKANLIGQRFGFLEVVTQAKDGYRWICKCDCGNNRINSTSTLRQGGAKSCGCRRALANKARAFPNEEGKKRWVYQDYQRGAIQRGLSFNLSRIDFDRMLFMPCVYCGALPTRHDSRGFVRNGIDRVNNSCGYELGNIVPCCKMCNHAKGSLSQKEFKSWLHQIARFQNGDI